MFFLLTELTGWLWARTKQNDCFIVWTLLGQFFPRFQTSFFSDESVHGHTFRGQGEMGQGSFAFGMWPINSFLQFGFWLICETCVSGQGSDSFWLEKYHHVYQQPLPRLPWKQRGLVCLFLSCLRTVCKHSKIGSVFKLCSELGEGFKDQIFVNIWETKMRPWDNPLRKMILNVKLSFVIFQFWGKTPYRYSHWFLAVLMQTQIGAGLQCCSAGMKAYGNDLALEKAEFR